MLKIGIGAPRIGLALGSGGPKGWAHLGVLEALDEAGIHAEVVAGSSAGGIAGAFYAANDLKGLRKVAEHSSSLFTTVGYLDFQIKEKGLITGRKFFNIIGEHLKAASFEELSRPLGIMATSLTDLGEVHICKGALLPALQASSAIPGFVAPLETTTMQLADGGILNPVPVNLAYRLGADVVIAIDLGAFNPREQVSSTLATLYRSIEIMSNHIRLLNRSHFPADIYIEPYLPDYRFLDFHRTEKAIEVGRAAVKNNLTKIRTMIRRARLRFRRLPSKSNASTIFDLSLREKVKGEPNSREIYMETVVRNSKGI